MKQIPVFFACLNGKSTNYLSRGGHHFRFFVHLFGNINTFYPWEKVFESFFDGVYIYRLL